MSFEDYTKFVGFYWTYPAPSLGFTKLPKEIDAAATVSKTIRYQRDVVRRYVAEIPRGHLLDEIVFLEAAPDRGTDAIKGDVAKALERCLKEGAQLVHVDFAEAGTRQHPVMTRIMKLYPVSCLGLSPDPIWIDGQEFDPVRHFQQMKALQQAQGSLAERRTKLAQKLADALAELGPSATNAALAAWLNAQNISTLHGRAWTADNLKKFRANKMG